MANYQIKEKDPDEVKTFTVSWSNEMNSGDTVSTSTFTVSSGITKDSESNTSTSGAVVLSGGTAGSVYTITNQVVTANGETLEKTFQVYVRER